MYFIKEMFESYTSLQKQIKRSEADLYLWQSLVDKVTSKKNFINYRL